MKHSIKVLFLLIVLLQINMASANESIVGTWEGILQPEPGVEMKIHFVINQEPDGSYSALLNSTEEGGFDNIKARSVIYESGGIKLEVPDLSGTYEGVVRDKFIEGKWQQEGTSISLNLMPYVKPGLSEEAMAMLTGKWHGNYANAYTLIFSFGKNREGKFEGSLDLPEAGAKNLPVGNIELTEGNIKIELPAFGGSFKGKLVDGELTGNVYQNDQPLPVTLKKGDYNPPAINLVLPKETMKRLSGQWWGELTEQGRETAVVFRFETIKSGEFVGFLDRPENMVKDIPVTKADFKDGLLTLFLYGGGVEYKAEFKGDDIDGKWGPVGREGEKLTLKKGEYKPRVINLNLLEEEKDLLRGKWQGKAGPITIVFRFMNSETGDFGGFMDLVEQDLKDIKFIDAKTIEGKLILKENLTGGEIKGQFTGNEFNGDWTQQNGNIVPLSMKKVAI